MTMRTDAPVPGRRFSSKLHRGVTAAGQTTVIDESAD
jgi:hypothetical protein